MRTILLLALASLVLAGCASDSSRPASTTPLDPAAPTVQVNDQTGGILGLITDNELLPLANVSIHLAEDPTRTTTSNEGGSFGFSLLAPGTYQVLAQRDGYYETARLATVTAGSVTSVQLQMEPLPSTKAYHLMTLKNGFMECAFAMMRVTLPGDCTPTSSATYISEKHRFDVRNFTTVVFEAQWKTADVLGFDIMDESKKAMYYRLRSTSPVRIQLDRCADYQSTHFATHAIPCLEEDLQTARMESKASYMGRLREETRVLDPLCHQPVPHPNGGNLFAADRQGCYGAGVAFDLRWQTFITVFYFETPSDVDQYSGRPDA